MAILEYWGDISFLAFLLAWKIKVNAGLISGAKSFRIPVGMLSRPAALCGLRPCRIFWTPA